MDKQKFETFKRDFLKDFGNHVRKLRKEQNLTQDDLGEKCFADAKKIGRVERGEYNFNFTSVYIIANGLGVTTEKLLHFNGVEKYLKML